MLVYLQTGKPATDCGVIYIGHIPHGFYEGAMKDYFSQFGKVTRLKVSRSRRVSGNLVQESLQLCQNHQES